MQAVTVNFQMHTNDCKGDAKPGLANLVFPGSQDDKKDNFSKNCGRVMLFVISDIEE